MESFRTFIGLVVWTGELSSGAACFLVKHCMVLIVALAVAGVTSGCGGGYGNSSGSPGNSGLTASITNPITTLQAGATYAFQATTPSSNGYAAGISWSISPSSGAGTLSNSMNNGFSSSVMYQAPTTPPSPNSVTISATPSDNHVGPSKDTFTIMASPMAMLEGPFAIEFSGFASTGETVGVIGSITADGGGNITGGSIDVNRNRAPSVRIGGVTGTYALDSKLRGSMSLTAASGFDHPLVVSFALASDRKSGRIADFTPDGLVVSGQLLRQDRTAFSLAKILSDFVFKLEAPSSDRVATVGKVSIGRNSILSGIADESKSGDGLVFSAAPIAGSLTAVPDENGRGTFILGTLAETSRFVFYVVTDSCLLFLETDSGVGALRTRQLGVAQRQMLPFSPATANASGRMSASGFDAQASSFGIVSVVGSLEIQNLSHATLSWDAMSAHATVSIDSLRSDTVTFNPSTGRGTIEIANGFANNFADSVAFYLANPGTGFFLDKTSGRFNRAIVGDLEAIGTE
jgi:hypothetical protein